MFVCVKIMKRKCARNLGKHWKPGFLQFQIHASDLFDMLNSASINIARGILGA